MAYLSSVPHVVFMVTTLKDNGKTNAALSGWSSFTGTGDDYCILMPTYKHSHTYHNIKRDGEFCVNFLSGGYVEQCKESIRKNQNENDELLESGLRPEPSVSIQPPRIKESFLRLECRYVWEHDLVEDSDISVICAKALHISVDQAFASKPVSERYNDDGFMLHLMAMKHPETGERIRGGIGGIHLIKEMEL